MSARSQSPRDDCALGAKIVWWCCCSITSESAVWYKALANGDKAVILYNNGTEPVPIAVTWPMIGWPASSSVVVRDLWQRETVGSFVGGYNATVGKHDVMFFRASLPVQ